MSTDKPVKHADPKEDDQRTAAIQELRAQLKKVFYISTSSPVNPVYQATQQFNVTNIHLIIDLCKKHHKYYKFFILELASMWKRIRQYQRILALSIIHELFLLKEYPVYRVRIGEKLEDTVRPLLHVTGKDVARMKKIIAVWKSPKFTSPLTPNMLEMIDHFLAEAEANGMMCECPDEYASFYFTKDNTYYHTEFLQKYISPEDRERLESCPPVPAVLTEETPPPSTDTPLADNKQALVDSSTPPQMVWDGMLNQWVIVPPQQHQQQNNSIPQQDSTQPQQYPSQQYQQQQQYPPQQQQQYPQQQYQHYPPPQQQYPQQQYQHYPSQPQTSDHQQQPYPPQQYHPQQQQYPQQPTPQQSQTTPPTQHDHSAVESDDIEHASKRTRDNNSSVDGDQLVQLSPPVPFPNTPSTQASDPLRSTNNAPTSHQDSIHPPYSQQHHTLPSNHRETPGFDSVHNHNTSPITENTSQQQQYNNAPEPQPNQQSHQQRHQYNNASAPAYTSQNPYSASQQPYNPAQPPQNPYSSAQQQPQQPPTAQQQYSAETPVSYTTNNPSNNSSAQYSTTPQSSIHPSNNNSGQNYVQNYGPATAPYDPNAIVPTQYTQAHLNPNNTATTGRLTIAQQRRIDPQSGFSIPHDQHRAQLILSHQLRVENPPGADKEALMGQYDASPQSLSTYAPNAPPNTVLAVSSTIWFAAGRTAPLDDVLREIVREFAGTDRVAVRKPPNPDLHFSFLRFESRYHACRLMRALKGLHLDVLYGDVYDLSAQKLIFANPYGPRFIEEYPELAARHPHTPGNWEAIDLSEPIPPVPWEKASSQKQGDKRYLPISLNFASAGIVKDTFDQLLGWGYVGIQQARGSFVESICDADLFTESPFVNERSSLIPSSGQVHVPPPKSARHQRTAGPTAVQASTTTATAGPSRPATFAPQRPAHPMGQQTAPYHQGYAQPVQQYPPAYVQQFPQSYSAQTQFFQPGMDQYGHAQPAQPFYAQPAYVQSYPQGYVPPQPQYIQAAGQPQYQYQPQHYAQTQPQYYQPQPPQ